MPGCMCITQLHRRYRTGDADPVMVAADILSALERDQASHAVITICRELALQRAEESRNRFAQNLPIRPLEGVPIAIKDNISVAGYPLTCGSRILESYIAPYHATAVERLLEAGAIPVAKTNMDEFAMGSSSETSWYGAVPNPVNHDYVPGGSSGGSAYLVARGIVPVALGSDTGGSVRQPAGFCGVIGIKPTYGRVSRYGLVAFASSLDQIGVLARSVPDAALVLEVISGQDSHDATSAPVADRDFHCELNQDLRGIILGAPAEYFTDGLEEEVRTAVENAMMRLAAKGAEIRPVSLPHTRFTIAAYYLVATAEASSNLARYDGIRYGLRKDCQCGSQDLYEETRGAGFGYEVKRRIMLGTFALSAGYYEAYYRKALQVRTCIREDFEKVFRSCHGLVTPVSPTPPFRRGQHISNPLAMYLSDVYTTSANLAGIPGIVVPTGLSSQGLPIGVQILSGAFRESTLFRIAESLTDDESL